jgi:hypothetical protein
MWEQSVPKILAECPCIASWNISHYFVTKSKSQHEAVLGQTKRKNLAHFPHYTQHLNGLGGRIEIKVHYNTVYK